jgi:cytidylate kinase
MLNIILISGPPGSGKTYTANIIASTMPDQNRVYQNTFINFSHIFEFTTREGHLYYDLIIVEEFENYIDIPYKIKKMIFEYNSYYIDPTGKKFLKPNLSIIFISQKKIDIDLPNYLRGRNNITGREIILQTFKSPL